MRKGDSGQYLRYKMSILAGFTTDRIQLVVAEVLTLLFFASALLQLNVSGSLRLRLRVLPCPPVSVVARVLPPSNLSQLCSARVSHKHARRYYFVRRPARQDDDFHIWGTYYLCHTILSGAVIFRRTFEGGSHTLVRAAIAMNFWSMMMATIAILRLVLKGGADGDDMETVKEEIMGSVLGIVAASYFTSLLSKGKDKRRADKVDH
mgnify:CR=1 FL=1